MWFDRLLDADAIVSDATKAVDGLARALGINHLGRYEFIRPASKTKLEFDSGRFLVSPDPSHGVTHIQVLARVPLTEDERRNSLPVNDFITAYEVHQPMHRPVRTHCLCIVTSRLPELTEMLRRRNVPHRLDPGRGYVWMGLSGEPVRYEPDADGGLFLEIVAGMPPDPLPDQQEFPLVEPGTIVRVTARSQLVADIDQVLSALRKSLDWPDEHDVVRRDRFGYRSAIIRPKVATSAVIELLQPTSSSGRIGKAYEAFGAGPFATRIGVSGLDTKLQELSPRGVRWDWIDPDNGRERVALDPRTVGGFLIELEELPRPV